MLATFWSDVLRHGVILTRLLRFCFCEIQWLALRGKQHFSCQRYLIHPPNQATQRPSKTSNPQNVWPTTSVAILAKAPSVFMYSAKAAWRPPSVRPWRPHWRCWHNYLFVRKARPRHTVMFIGAWAVGTQWSHSPYCNIEVYSGSLPVSAVVHCDCVVPTDGVVENVKNSMESGLRVLLSYTMGVCRVMLTTEVVMGPALWTS